MSEIEYVWPGEVGVLAPGDQLTATATYDLTVEDIGNGNITNTATASGDDPDGTPVIDEDTVTKDLVGAPSIELVKTSSFEEETASAGDDVTYSFDVTNTGNVLLTNVSIADPMEGLTWADEVDPTDLGDLAPGETLNVSATYALTQADIDTGTVVNTATADGTPPGGEDTPPVTDESTEETPLPGESSVDLVKTSTLDNESVAAGDIVTYTFVVTNTGNTTLAIVAIDDPMVGLTWADGVNPADLGALAPGDSHEISATYVLTQADIDTGSVVNTATVTGTPPGDDVPSVTDDSTEDTPLPPNPSIDLEKIALYDGDSLAGDTVTYEFTVTNTGNVSLTDVMIVDQLAGISWTTDTGGLIGDLASGEQVTLQARYTVAQSDIDAGLLVNDATATGTTPDGGTVTDDDSAETPFGESGVISLVKTASGATGESQPGDIITYTLTVTNVSNITISDVTVADPMEGLVWAEGTVLEIGELAPGDEVVIEATYALTEVDLVRGHVANTAYVTGVTPGGDPVKDEDTVTNLVEPLPTPDPDPDPTPEPDPDPTPDKPIPGPIGDLLAKTGFTGATQLLIQVMLLIGLGSICLMVARRRTSEE